jgi:hypothetical protein
MCNLWFKKNVPDDGPNKGLKHVGLIHSYYIVHTKTYNKSAGVGQVLCVQMTMHGTNSIKLIIYVRQGWAGRSNTGLPDSNAAHSTHVSTQFYRHDNFFIYLTTLLNCKRYYYHQTVKQSVHLPESSGPNCTIFSLMIDRPCFRFQAAWTRASVFISFCSIIFRLLTN